LIADVLKSNGDSDSSKHQNPQDLLSHACSP
jgi:hypothetical protein